MELICPLKAKLVLYTVLLGSMCTVGEAANIIGTKETTTVASYQEANAMTDSSYINREPKDENKDSSQLPPFICFDEGCLLCGETENPTRCFFRGFFRVFAIGSALIVSILFIGIFVYLCTCRRKKLKQIPHQSKLSESKVLLL